MQRPIIFTAVLAMACVGVEGYYHAAFYYSKGWAAARSSVHQSGVCPSGLGRGVGLGGLGLRMQMETGGKKASEVDWRGLQQMGDDWLRNGPKEEVQVRCEGLHVRLCARWRRGPTRGVNILQQRECL